MYAMVADPDVKFLFHSQVASLIASGALFLTVVVYNADVSSRSGPSDAMSVKKCTFSQPFKEECIISDVVRIGSIIIFHLRNWYEKPSSLYCVMSLNYFW